MLPFALALAISSQVSVSPLTGGVLVEECKKRDGMVLDPCVAYIMGASDILSVQRKFCLNSPSDALQVVGVVRKYLRDNPDGSIT